MTDSECNLELVNLDGWKADQLERKIWDKQKEKVYTVRREKAVKWRELLDIYNNISFAGDKSPEFTEQLTLF